MHIFIRGIFSRNKTIRKHKSKLSAIAGIALTPNHSQCSEDVHLQTPDHNKILPGKNEIAAQIIMHATINQFICFDELNLL